MSIIIGADIVPVYSNMKLFEKAEAEELIGEELKNILGETDYRIFNLETPLTDKQTPIKKYGPVLVASKRSVAGMKKMGINLFTLANNHIMDQGIQGLQSTMQVLEASGISYTGAGMDLSESQRYCLITIKGKRYGIYACAEHEFSIAKENQPGANPFDPLESLDHVAQMKSQCDYAIVLYHGGKELYRYPSPNLQKTCRKLIDKGADLVICQHSHCIGCKEEYHSKTIVYGQGNFHFTKRDNEFWNTGLLVRLDDAGSISYIPVTRSGNAVRLANKDESKQILIGFEKRSEEITQDGFVENKYMAFAEEKLPEYILFFLGVEDNLLFRAANKLSGQRLRRHITKHVRTKRGLGMETYIDCEAHRELFLRGLEHKE